MKRKNKSISSISLKKYFIAVLLVQIAATVIAVTPSVNVYRLTYDGISEQTANSINDAIYSFIVEIKNYTINDFRDQPIPADTSLIKSNFIFYGSILGEDDGVKVNLVLKNIDSNTTRLISKYYSNPNIILIESRSLVRDLFDSDSILESPSEMPTEAQSKSIPTDISGRWIGEDIINSITLLPNNRGIITLKSGVSISVETELNDKILTVTQKSRISAKQFSDVPIEIANLAAQKAKPLKWVLTISDDMMQLKGTRTATIIEHNGKDLKSIKSVDIPVTWTRK